MGSQKRIKKKKRKLKTVRAREYDEERSVAGGYCELLDFEENKPLRKLPSYSGYPKDLGREVFSYSNCRTWIDFSPQQRKQIKRSPQGVVLVVLDCMLIVWFLVSFIYRMNTEAEQGKVALSMLPSFIIVGVCTVILLVSYFGVWGKIVRFAYRHNLVRGADAASRALHAETAAEMNEADANRSTEYAVTVTEKYVAVALLGQRYNFDRAAVYLKVKLENDELYLTFTVDGYSFGFSRPVPKKYFVGLKKAFGDKLTVAKSGDEKSGKTFKKILSENLGFAAFGVCFAAFAILLIIASCLWLPIPPFLGVFFLLMSGFVFCNIFSGIPIVGEIGFQSVFASVALVVPPWAYVWIETQITGTQLSFFYVLTHCSPFAVGFGFFWCMGFYALSHVICKTVDYIRFGR